jgi:hypothetical protein
VLPILSEIRAMHLICRKEPMFNVASLDSSDFLQMADWAKSNELRQCRQPDLELECVVPGEPILFLDMQSERALLSRVVSIRRIAVKGQKSKSFLIYVIRISQNRRLIELPMTRMPGWLRLSRKDLAPFLKGVAA